MEVTVLITAYNHEKYIAEAIDSALMQRTNFDYEIFIGEDCSQDNTRKIVVEYQNKYPNKIRVKYWEKNVGLTNNFAYLLLNSKGKYISILSGDDFWTDSYMLQKQRDFLRDHPEYSLYGINAVVLYETTKMYVRKGHAKPEIITTGDLFLRNPFMASQNMFKNVFNKLPEEFYDADTEDRQLYMILSQCGNLYFNPLEFGGVYRVHCGSVTNSRTGHSADIRIARLKERIRKNAVWNKYFDYRYDFYAKESSINCYIKIFKVALRTGRFKEAALASSQIPANRFHKFTHLLVLYIFKLLNSCFKWS